MADYAIGDKVNHVCRGHYKRIFEFKHSKVCSTCTLNTSSWKLLCNIVKSPDDLCDAFSMERGTTFFTRFVTVVVLVMLTIRH